MVSSRCFPFKIKIENENEQESDLPQNESVEKNAGKRRTPRQPRRTEQKGNAYVTAGVRDSSFPAWVRDCLELD